MLVFRSNSTVNPIALGFAYLFPILLLVWLITRFGVNVPFWDQWELIPLFSKLQAGQVSFQDFFAQHNEHRIFVPRVIFVALAFLSGWNNKLEMYGSVGFAIATFGLIIVLALRDKSSTSLFHLTNVLCGAFLFSLGQWENWLWGFQLSWFLVNFCVVLAIACISFPVRLLPRYRLMLAGMACTVASFSLAHGLFAWLALFPLILAIPGKSRHRIGRLVGWLVAFMLVAVIYQIGYVKPTQHPDLLFFLKEPATAAAYLFTIVGNILGRAVIPPVWTGALLLLGFLALNGYWLSQAYRPIAQRMAPWIALGWFALLFALVTTLGRAGFGVEQANASRYVTVMVLLVVAVLQLGRIILSHLRGASPLMGSAFLAGVLVAMLIANSGEAIAFSQSQFNAKTEGKVCLELIQFLHRAELRGNHSCLNRLYLDAQRIRDLSRSLAQLNFRQFPNRQALEFVPNPEAQYGAIEVPGAESPISMPRSRLPISGWAGLPEQSRSPEIVLLSYNDEQLFRSVGTIHLPRPDIVELFDAQNLLHSGWEIVLRRQQLPVGDYTLKAWIYDRGNGRFLQLSNEPQLRIE
jgi:hypothetical protein